MAWGTSPTGGEPAIVIWWSDGVSTRLLSAVSCNLQAYEINRDSR